MSVSQGPNFSRVWNGFVSWKLWSHLSDDQQFTDIDPGCIKWTSMHLHPFQECQISAGLKNYIQKISTTVKSNIWKYCLLLKADSKITKLFTDIMAKQCSCCKFIHQNYPWHDWDHQWINYLENVRKHLGDKLIDSEPFVVPWDCKCFKEISIQSLMSIMCVAVGWTGYLPFPLTAPLNIQYYHTQYLMRVRNITSWVDCEENSSFSGSIAHGNFLGFSVHRDNNPTVWIKSSYVWVIYFLQVPGDRDSMKQTKKG